MTSKEYVNAELKCVKMDGEYPATVKFFSGVDDSRHISLTQENVEAIIDYLENVFITLPSEKDL